VLITSPRRRLTAALTCAVLALSACAGAGSDTDESGTAATEPAVKTSPQGEDSQKDAGEGTDTEQAADREEGDHHAAPAVDPKPLRKGETRQALQMTEPYTPSAPYGSGNDDYRCFLLDPELDEPAWLTGTHVLPGNPDVVHHVILFEVPPSKVTEAEQMDAVEEGPGWTCFGGTGLEPVGQVNDASWLGAWAPGGEESVSKPGLGKRLAPGTRIVMQVHYNLLAGGGEDVSSTLLRLAPGRARLQNLHTMLLPGPVELPCRPRHRVGALCDRETALADVKERFGGKAGATADLLYVLCGGAPRAAATQSCTRGVPEDITIHGVAGHMHLLGRSISIEVHPGTDRARTILDIPLWDFDDQAARPIEPVSLKAFDQIKVTCRHDQSLRDRLPAFETQREDRYVLWGEGSTDEMCLGMLQVTHP
jgi:hypothetical protein